MIVAIYPLQVAEAFLTTGDGDPVRCSSCGDTRFDMRVFRGAHGPAKCTTCGTTALGGASIIGTPEPSGR